MESNEIAEVSSFVRKMLSHYKFFKDAESFLSNIDNLQNEISRLDKVLLETKTAVNKATAEEEEVKAACAAAIADAKASRDQQLASYSAEIEAAGANYRESQVELKAEYDAILETHEKSLAELAAKHASATERLKAKEAELDGVQSNLESLRAKLEAV